MVAFAYEVKHLATQLNAALAVRFRPLGLTPVQADALIALDELGPVTLKTLAKHLVAESGHPSRLVSRLVGEGYISRKSSNRDGRAVELDLTDRGREMARQAIIAREPLVVEFTKRFGGKVDDSLQLLRQFSAALESSN